jgi:hypothetical protein
MADAEQQDIAAGRALDLELIRKFMVVMDKCDFDRYAVWLR